MSARTTTTNTKGATRGFLPHAPPLALLLCHAWPHAARAARVSRVAHGDNTSYHAWYIPKIADATRGMASQILVPLVGEVPTRGA